MILFKDSCLESPGLVSRLAFKRCHGLRAVDRSLPDTSMIGSPMMEKFLIDLFIYPCNFIPCISGYRLSVDKLGNIFKYNSLVHQYLFTVGFLR